MNFSETVKMYTVIDVVQGSLEWLSWRNNGIGASDAPIIMGDSPWTTPYELWRMKRGELVRTANAAMRRGTEMELEARLAYEDKTGNIMQPICVQSIDNTWMRASLDGLSFDGDLALEIKCPGAEDHAVAMDGEVPEKYDAQLAHTLMLTGAKSMHYWSYDGKEGALIVVFADPDYAKLLVERETAFHQSIVSGIPPKLGPRDYIERDDAEWAKTVIDYNYALQSYEVALQNKEKCRDRLLLLSEQKNSRGAGIQVSWFEKRGNVEYKKIPELADVNLDKYRHASRIEARITEMKEKL